MPAQYDEVVNGTANGHVKTQFTNNIPHDPIVKVNNPHLQEQDDDFLYHFGISKNEAGGLKEAFGDVKYVCTGGSPSRLKMYAELFHKDSGRPLSENLSRSDRFCMYKTGPVLWINHGMGVPSLSIMLVETIKLLHYAGAKDVCFIRIGTSGGIGVNPGTVIVSSGAINGLLEQKHIQFIQGKIVKRDALLDKGLCTDLYNTATSAGIPVDSGLTLCADDFYEGQMRLDGAFCEYSADDKFDFLRQLYSIGVKNFEMESTGFAAMTTRAGVRGAIICVALLNRLNGDQVTMDKSCYHDYEMRPYRVVSAYLRNKLTEQNIGG